MLTQNVTELLSDHPHHEGGGLATQQHLMLLDKTCQTAAIVPRLNEGNQYAFQKSAQPKNVNYHDG